MTERPRDEVLRIVLASATETSMYVTEAAHAIVENLLAAGLVVPAGLTAEKLREAAAWIGGEDARGHGSVLASELRAWADALELRETPE